MHKVITFTQGTAFEDGKKGKKINVEKLYAYVPEDCEGDLSCVPPVIRFVDSQGVKREIPLEQLFNFMEANNLTDTVFPLAITAGNINPSADSQTQITIDWTEGAADSNIASVEVYRDGVLIATVNAGVEQYIDTGLTAATTYGYSLLVIDQAGNRGPMSDVVSETTDA